MKKRKILTDRELIDREENLILKLNNDFFGNLDIPESSRIITFTCTLLKELNKKYKFYE